MSAGGHPTKTAYTDLLRAHKFYDLNRAIAIYEQNSWTVEEGNEILQLLLKGPCFKGSQDLIRMIVERMGYDIIPRLQKKCLSHSIRNYQPKLFETVTKYFPHHLEGINRKAIELICLRMRIVQIAMKYAEFRRRVVSQVSLSSLYSIARPPTSVFLSCVLSSYVTENAKISPVHVPRLADLLLISKSSIVGDFIRHIEKTDPTIIRNMYGLAIWEKDWDGVRWLYQQYPIDRNQKWFIGMINDNLVKYFTLCDPQWTSIQLVKMCHDVPSIVNKLNPQVVDLLLEQIARKMPGDASKNLVLRKFFVAGYRPKSNYLKSFRRRILRFHYFVIRLLFLKGIVRRYLMNKGKIPMTVAV